MNLRNLCRLNLIFVSVVFVFHISLAQPSEQVVSGEKLFKANCASCHKIDKKLIGPALKGVEQRWVDAGDFEGKTGREWLNIWIRNSSEAIKSGYPYAVEMGKYDAQVMTAFPQLTDEDIDHILAYIEYVPPASTTAATSEQTPATSGDRSTELFLYGFIAVLLIIIAFLWRLLSNLNRMVMEKQGLPVPEPVPFYRNKKFAVTIVLVLVIYIGYAAVNGAINLGRQQGYMPEQPIKFSHKLHAGIDKIDCQYCHSSAAKGKASAIPSINVCMNCHKGIQEGAINGKYGRKEITKIYAAAGFDPNTLSYHSLGDSAARQLYTEWLKGDPNRKYTQADIEEVLAFVNKPVEWVRIHNLPDHVYFNHAQHVAVAGLECQTCHGPVETMEELYQFAPLSMGWCLNCHRNNEVNFAQNNYYSDYHRLHEQLKAGKIDRITVETIGGTECQKCHY
ncbi:MAG: cytochrome c [Chitinophagales bacterium]|nr:MAG: cytochrome c [Chitinophagales bacterium]